MKIQCNVCEAAEAMVLCCADEAALCWDCDEKVHAANKLAGKHQRVPLLSASDSSSTASSHRVPKCDICQEASAYIFCLEDRAILCRNCDVAVHSANPSVSIHQRFLLTGVKVGLESSSSFPSLSKKQSISAKELPNPSPKHPKSGPSPMPFSWEMNGIYSRPNDEKMEPLGTFFEESPMHASITEWPLDEFFGFTDHNSSSKDEGGMLEISKGSSQMSYPFSEKEGSEERLGQVPEIPSPSTGTRSTGLEWLVRSAGGPGGDDDAVAASNLIGYAMACRCATIMALICTCYASESFSQYRQPASMMVTETISKEKKMAVCLY